jgi:tetratricopeptide (TPR) repeat protein
MTNYVWTAKDKFGITVVKEVTANSAKDAENILLAEGYTELVLKEDEVVSAVVAGFSSKTKMFGEEIKVTAEQRLKHRDKTTTGFLSAILKGIEESKYFCILVAGLAIYQGVLGHWLSVLLLASAFGIWLVFLVCIRLPSIYYHKLNQAADWYRWDEVLSIVETLKTIGKFSAVKVPATELTRNRAKAMAGKGQLAEALAEYKQCEGRPDCPSWLYKLFVASIYTTAKQYDKAIEYNLLSIEENPTATAWIDLSNRYARYKRDPVKAREAMAQADKSPISDVAKPFRIRCLGIIAYLEGDHAAAKSNLESAIAQVEPLKSRPFRDGHLSIARAYLCCVLAKRGDLPAAKQCFAQAKAYLMATQEDELLAECRQLLGEPK